MFSAVLSFLALSLRPPFLLMFLLTRCLLVVTRTLLLVVLVARRLGSGVKGRAPTLWPAVGGLITRGGVFFYDSTF